MRLRYLLASQVGTSIARHMGGNGPQEEDWRNWPETKKLDVLWEYDKDKARDYESNQGRLSKTRISALWLTVAGVCVIVSYTWNWASSLFRLLTSSDIISASVVLCAILFGLFWVLLGMYAGFGLLCSYYYKARLDADSLDAMLSGYEISIRIDHYSKS